MTGTYLVSSFADKDLVKALGARWDPARRQWYVPQGRELAPFAQWLPTGHALEVSTSTALVDTSSLGSKELTLTSKRGVPLSQLLQGVAGAVSQAFKSGVWTLVEAVDVRVRNGHVYLEVSERDSGGVITAKANAVIWASTAAQILPAFESATGAQIGPGIKLLVRARPVFKPQFGFSLELDAIDPDYTLGDLEARKRELRERLQREGLFHLNRALPNPWDYNLVLVIAPEGGAGLGDFQAEAKRLEDLGICSFMYVHSRFQGEGAAPAVREALLDTLTHLHNEGTAPDAVAIIRGGGAINDMAWLNDYGLVRAVCELQIPVLTGIGHERDNTVLDEVANIRFDTPSKVIGGIERVILQRAQEVKRIHAELLQDAARISSSAQRFVVERYTSIESGARREIARSRQHSTGLATQVQVSAAQTLRMASERTERQMADLRQFSYKRINDAKSNVPALMAGIRAEARQNLQEARAAISGERNFVLERAASDLRTMSDASRHKFQEVSSQSFKVIAEAKYASQSLMREIAGQGPEKTLNRGFAVVQDLEGKAITSSCTTASNVVIRFWDGTRSAQILDTGTQ